VGRKASGTGFPDEEESGCLGSEGKGFGESGVLVCATTLGEGLEKLKFKFNKWIWLGGKEEKRQDRASGSL
jgi:hypothetical protein